MCGPYRCYQQDGIFEVRRYVTAVSLRMTEVILNLTGVIFNLTGVIFNLTAVSRYMT